jgi:hypothetical protein
MTTYDITIHEFESGLTPTAVEQLIQHSIADDTAKVTVTEPSHE